MNFIRAAQDWASFVLSVSHPITIAPPMKRQVDAGKWDAWRGCKELGPDRQTA